LGCATPAWQSLVCRQLSISSRIHNFPRFNPLADRGAFWLDASPYGAYSALCQFLLRLVPSGPFHAPPQTLFLLDLPTTSPDWLRIWPSSPRDRLS
jgi:hypothetical protein